MPSSARILQFPRRRTSSEALRPEEARAIAIEYLGRDRSGADSSDEILASVDVLFALCSRLRELMETSPATVAKDADQIYRVVSRSRDGIGLFDECDYLLGEFALIASAAWRLIGKHEEAGRWIDRAEAAFRHIVNSAPQLANVSYARLALFFEIRRFEDIVELVPSLLKSYERLGMTAELRKTEFLEAMALKQCSRDSEAYDRFSTLRGSLEKDGDIALLGHVLIETGSYSATRGRSDEALADYEKAASLLARSGRPMALAHLSVTMGESWREAGNLPRALEAFRSAVGLYAQLEMSTFVAYTRLFVADALLKLNRSREAEWEILAALPTIEEQKMVPEGFMAVALLKESVRQRKTDPNALRELREHLQAANQK